jgi:hypothetical protein
VQVIEGAPLVRGKATAIKVVVHKTGSDPVNDVSVRVSTGSFVSTQFYVADPANVDEFHTLVAPNTEYPLNFGPGEDSKAVYFFGNGFTPYGNSYQVEAVVDYLDQIEESNEENNRLLSEPVSVQDVRWGILPDLYIHFVRLDWEERDNELFRTVYDEATAFIGAVFPVADNRFTPGRSDNLVLSSRLCTRGLDGRMGRHDLVLCVMIWLLPQMRMVHPTADRYVAVVPTGWIAQNTRFSADVTGLALVPLPFVIVEVHESTGPNGVWPMAVAHEVGHTYELPRTTPVGCREDYDNCNPDRAGFPLTGPLEYPIGSRAAPGMWVARRMPIAPDNDRGIFSFMGTRLPDTAPPEYHDALEYWGTTIDYQHMLAVNSTGESSTVSSSDSTAVILASGTISPTGVASFDNWYVIPEGELSMSSAGAYSFAFEDENGRVIYQHSFELAGAGDAEEITEATPFFFTLPHFPEASQIVLRRGEETLATRQVSANVPVVTDLAARYATESDEIVIEWSGSDADGDALAYTLLYSDDDGENWVPLAFNQTDTHYTWNVADFPGEVPYRFRLIATDGIHTTTAETVAEADRDFPTSPALSTELEQEQGLATDAADEDEAGEPSAEFQSLDWLPIALVAAGVVVGLTLLAGGGLLLWHRRRLARQPDKVAGRFCIYCGAEYSPQGRFCIKCGRPRT